jgi:cation/acetate symporter
MAPQALPQVHAAAQGTAQRRSTGARSNFLALVFCLMLGTAAMPHVLTRYYTTPSVSQARRSVGLVAELHRAAVPGAPALAVMVKYEVFTELVGTAASTSLPDWIRRWSKLDSSLVSVQDINGDGLLQLAELRLGADMIVLAAPEIGGLPLVVTYLVAAGGLAAALSTADGLLLTISNALSHDFYFRVVRPNAPGHARVMFSKLLVLVTAVLAAWVASLRITDILQFVSAAFSLAAATFFPALVLGIFWRRANRAGAVAGMLAGAGLCLWYMARNTAGAARVLRPGRGRWPTCAGSASTRWPPACSACRWAAWCWCW